MSKRLSAVVGEYTKDGQQKAEWQNVGVLIVGKNGKEYALLDPAVNLAGVLLKQNVLAVKKGEQPSDMVMSSVFDENNQAQNNNQGQQQNTGFQQGAQQQQGGFQQQAPQSPTNKHQAPRDANGFTQAQGGFQGQ